MLTDGSNWLAYWFVVFETDSCWLLDCGPAWVTLLSQPLPELRFEL